MISLPPLTLSLLLAASVSAQGSILVDHRCTDLKAIPIAAIAKAKKSLHIVYGHTSHGSQLTTGMSGLVKFTGGVGGPQFAWNRGGSNGALDLHDRGMAGDVGYYPKWVNETKKYLDNPAHAHVNVVIWSWCGQVSRLSSAQLISNYLKPMSELEKKYPKRSFVYMTGHLDIRRRSNTTARNEQIREYCRKNGKVLFDFADIESYSPDGRWYPYADDACNYYDSKLKKLGNWAIEWQNKHKKGVDWYDCSSAHSQPLNANLKAYAAWWLWARLAGWKPGLDSDRGHVSTTKSGPVRFSLDAGSQHAQQFFLMLGSASGTQPGMRVNSKLSIPLNYDAFTGLGLSAINTPVFAKFLGKLDRNGSATATLTLPRLNLASSGIRLDFAYLLFAKKAGFTSQALELRLRR
ncbi:MAG: hypothetical protein CSA62_07655 [Planctomycetota bacterium]|nr:MAG: hypothetical protein CSA62_07655 [Planctomycetota bacterium]